MADLSDVANALVTLAAAIAYPNGTAQASIISADVRVFVGWPIPALLDADLAAGKVQVSVFPMPGMERVISSAFGDWSAPTPPANTLTLTGTGQTVTVGGTVSTPQNAALVVDGKGYVYSVQAGDTLSSIATALAALVNVDQTATAAGAVVTIPGAKYISPRVGGVGTSQRETLRLEQTFMVTVWAPSPILRDQLAPKINSALSGTTHLLLADQQSAALRYRRSSQDDASQKAGLFRRDLVYAVEYSTYETETDYQIAVTQENVSAGPSLDAQFPIKTIVE